MATMNHTMDSAEVNGNDTEDLNTLAATLTAQAEDMLRRTDQLLAEFQHLSDLRQTQRNLGVAPGQKSLVQSVKSEGVFFQKQLLALQDELELPTGADADARQATALLNRLSSALRCSNVPALESTWSIIKRSHSLSSLSCAFSRHPSIGPCPICLHRRRGNGSAGTKKCPPKGRQAPSDLARVDAVVDGGAEWLRVLGISERRLLLQMAQGGWDWGVEEDGEGMDDAEWEDSDVSVVVAVRQLVEAARANRHDYRVPRVHVVLTRVREGYDAEIDRLIWLLRGAGRRGGGDDVGSPVEVEVVVDCAGSEFLTASPPSTEAALQNLVGDQLEGLTQTVSLDCSVLVSLASDVTHVSVEVRPWHRGDIAQQIADEREEGSSLVRFLYPALKGRRLVCTRAAATRFWEIVNAIATPAEAARAAIIFGGRDGHKDGWSLAERIAELQKLSEHVVEPELVLPVEVVDGPDSAVEVSAHIREGRLPAVAGPVLADMSELNRDVHLYGWLEGVTTVTANHTLAKQIVRLVEEHRSSDEEAGPKVWVHPVTRALATKGRPKRDETP